MKFTALISGGKDSCFNIIKCLEKGHEIVSLANLQPLYKDELNSYMYQTIGHEGISYISQATKLPLYSGYIEGVALNTNKDYTFNCKDEVEDLYNLLKIIKNKSNIDGVSCGAIWSEYQKNRLDHVCERLDLVPLCYLWGLDQSELLSEMVEDHPDETSINETEVNDNRCVNGNDLLADGGKTHCNRPFEVVIIKTACIGLDPISDLGAYLHDIEPKLRKNASKYGINLCGEGGEYETFVTRCRLKGLYKNDIAIRKSTKYGFEDGRPIAIDSHNSHRFSDPTLAPVGYLKLDELELI